MVRALLCLAVLGCSSKEPAKKQPAPVVVTLPDRSAPVELTTISAKITHVLATAKEYLIIDAKGALSFGKLEAGTAPWAADPVERRRRGTGTLDYDYDGFAVLSRDTTAEAVILADVSSPARVALRDGIRVYPWKPTFLATNTGNTVVPYRFGEEAWDDVNAPRVIADKLVMPEAQSDSLVIEFTDAATTGKLVAALAAAAERGVKRVRVHRMMGWGDVPPLPVLALKGVGNDDDEFGDGPSTATPGEPKVEGNVSADSIGTMLASAAPRFRYCFAMRMPRAKSGSVDLAFDIDKDGVITNATGKARDQALASCAAGALFDMLVPRDGITEPGHASVTIEFAHPSEVAVEPADKKGTGWWCWSGTDSYGPVGMCAREELQCTSTLAGYSGTMKNLGAGEMAAECKQQKTAWESASSRPMPTKAMCIANGDRCTAVR